MVEEVITFVWLAPIVVGLVIGLVELFFVHHDELGMGWLGHGIHALPVAVILTWISMNSQWVLTLPFMSWLPAWIGLYVIPVVIGLVAAIKVKGAAAIAKGGSVGESLPHALIIGALIAASPFVWFYLIVPLGILPAWLLM